MKALTEKKKLVLVAPRILASGQVEIPRNKSLKLLKDIGKAASTLFELQEQAVTEVYDLH